MKIIKSLLFSICTIMLVSLSNVMAQNVVTQDFKLNDWTLFTSFMNVNAIDTDQNNKIWAAASGGLFIYNSETDTIEHTFNNDILLYHNITAIKFAPAVNSMIVCASDGTVEIIDSEFNAIHLTAIRDKNFPDPKINDILVTGTKAYLAGGFGIAVLDLENKVFVTSIEKISTLTKNTPVNKLLKTGNVLWTATKSGIAKVDLNSIIENPNSWELYTSADGIPESEIIDLIIFNDTLFAATNRFLVRFESDSLFSIVKNYDVDIKSLSIENNRLITAMDWKFEYMDSPDTYYPPSFINKAVFSDLLNKTIFLFTRKGIGYATDNKFKYIYPNCPNTNLFMSLDIDNKGRVWIAPTNIQDRSGGYGFYMFDNAKWYNFTNETNQYPFFRSNTFCEVNTQSDGSVLLALDGGGFAEVKDSSDSFSVSAIDTNNSPLKGLDGGYLLTGDAKTDRNGNLWLTNYGAQTSGPAFNMREKNGNWHSYQNCIRQNDRRFVYMTIDNYGTKWLGSFPGDGGGLLYFNENNTIENISDDICGIISASSHPVLSENSQTCLRVDKQGMVWFGSLSGLYVIVNPSAVLNNAKPIIRSIKNLAGKSISDIHIDALDNKWVSTSTGVWVLNSDASEVLAILDKTNTPISSQYIYSVVTNPETGEVFFGTRDGLYRASSLSIAPKQTYSIQCYPQPFDVNKDEEMTIDGLSENSEINILTLDGICIRSLNAKGRKAIWDGKDNNGNTVNNGVFLINASSSNSNTSAVAKITVISK